MASLAVSHETRSITFAAEQVAHLQGTLGRMEHVLGVLSEGIAWTDDEGNIMWCNPAFARMAMRPAVAVVGKPVEQILLLHSRGGSVEPSQHPVRRVLSGDTSSSGRTLIDTYQTERGGQTRHLEVYSACLRAASGTSAMMVVRDNTERHLAEQWLEAESQRAELVRAVTAASNQAGDPRVALGTVLALVCRFLVSTAGRASTLEGGDDLLFPETADLRVGSPL
jgi:transcriptional regulator with PAS, ATPase and Fis domain